MSAWHWQVERQADDFQRLKQRALESLLRMKRAGKLEDFAEDWSRSWGLILGLYTGYLGIMENK